MKYIDIEFENQPVTLPLFANEVIHGSSDIDVTVGELINAGDISREICVANMYQNTLIPPSRVSHLNNRRMSKTRALQKVHAPIDSVISQEMEKKQKFMKQQEIYVQDEKFRFFCYLFPNRIG